MDIFISHTFDDEKLAKKLKKILEKNDCVNIAHIAQENLEFNIEISEKIMNAIKKSDLVIVIITKNSKYSISVGQEIGYAYKKIPIIPLVEENAKSGIFCEGKDTISFTKDNFEKSCNNALKHILKHQSKKMDGVTSELLKESMYSRSEYCNKICNIIFETIYYRFNISKDNSSSVVYGINDEYFQIILKKIEYFFKNGYIKNKQHLFEIDYKQIQKLNSELIIFKNDIGDIKQKYYNTKFHYNEQNLLFDLHDSLDHIEENNWNQDKYIKYADNPKSYLKQTQMNKQKVWQIDKSQSYLYHDVRKIVINMIDILKIYVQYNIEFPNDAFKKI